MNAVRIGIIGCGGIARGVHIPELKKSNGGTVMAICDIDETALKTVGDQFNIEEKYRFRTFQELIACDSVDAVEVCTPNFLHAEMAIAAIDAKKPVNIEKPIAMNVEQAEKIRTAVEREKVPAMMCFSYRFKPAVRYAKHILEKGLIGDILSIHVEYLKSSAFMEGRRLDWRFVKEYAGTGVLGDLGIHLIDMTRFLIGEFDSVCARKGTVVTERKKLDSEEMGKVETDDYCSFLADMKCGATGIFSITRCAIGNENTIRFDIYGRNGVIKFDLNKPDVLGICIGEIDVQTNGLHTVKVPSKFSLTQEQAFVDFVRGKRDEFLPDVMDGVKCQIIADSLLLSSDENRWVKI